MRHPLNPELFIMSRNTAPATVSSAEDLVEYKVSDADAFNPGSPEGFVERRIHSEIYKRHADIHAVVHGHSEAIVPYSITSLPLRACHHMAGFLGTDPVPVYDSAVYTQPEDDSDLMVHSESLGYGLAQHFDGGNVVTLMRGHGFTAVAESVEQAVLCAIYTQKNAAIQTTALTISAASGNKGEIYYLTEAEARAAALMARWSANRPWKLWVREVEADAMYVNHCCFPTWLLYM